MTREEFEKLQIGDKVRHPFGSVGVVVSKGKQTYSLKDGGFDGGDGLDVVSFAWNEGEIVSNDTYHEQFIIPNGFQCDCKIIEWNYI